MKICEIWVILRLFIIFVRGIRWGWERGNIVKRAFIDLFFVMWFIVLECFGDEIWFIVLCWFKDVAKIIV
jgi:hypothetical protein